MIDFKGHRFERDIILLCVRWYLAYPLSYRNLAEMMEERGVKVDASNMAIFAHPLEKVKISVSYWPYWEASYRWGTTWATD